MQQRGKNYVFPGVGVCVSVCCVLVELVMMHLKPCMCDFLQCGTKKPTVVFGQKTLLRSYWFPQTFLRFTNVPRSQKGFHITAKFWLNSYKAKIRILVHNKNFSNQNDFKKAKNALKSRFLNFSIRHA